MEVKLKADVDMLRYRGRLILLGIYNKIGAFLVLISHSCSKYTKQLKCHLFTANQLSNNWINPLKINWTTIYENDKFINNINYDIINRSINEDFWFID